MSDRARKVKTCFVIGPIGADGSDIRKHSDLLLHAIFKHVLEGEEFFYKVKRADEDTDPGLIGDRVISDILHSDIVIADLTDLNPNAFYELGIRHAARKPFIHFARIGTKLPFDTVSQRTIFVDVADWNSIQQARHRLSETVRTIEAPEFEISSPLTQANANFRMRESSDPRDQLIAQVTERLSLIEGKVDGSRRANPPISSSANDQMRENVTEYVVIDMKSILGKEAKNTVILDENSMTFGELLDKTYFIMSQINRNIKPYTYNKKWVLLNSSGKKIDSPKSMNQNDDRPLIDVGVRSGDTLRVIPLVSETFQVAQSK